MTGNIAVQNVGLGDGIIFYRIDLELGSVPEMLKNLAVIIGNCNFHSCFTSFP